MNVVRIAGWTRGGWQERYHGPDPYRQPRSKPQGEFVPSRNPGSRTYENGEWREARA